MDILERIDLIDDFCKYIHNINKVISNYFSVYLFGSILRIDITPKDIDVLIVYTYYDRSEIIRWEDLLYSYGNFIGLPVDCTILSKEEVIDTKFIERINAFYII